MDTRFLSSLSIMLFIFFFNCRTSVLTVKFHRYQHEPHRRELTYKSYRQNVICMRDDEKIILANLDILSHVPPDICGGIRCDMSSRRHLASLVLLAELEQSGFFIRHLQRGADDGAIQLVAISA